MSGYQRQVDEAPAAGAYPALPPHASYAPPSGAGAAAAGAPGAGAPMPQHYAHVPVAMPIANPYASPYGVVPQPPQQQPPQQQHQAPLLGPPQGQQLHYVQYAPQFAPAYGVPVGAPAYGADVVYAPSGGVVHSMPCRVDGWTKGILIFSVLLTVAVGSMQCALLGKDYLWVWIFWPLVLFALLLAYWWKLPTRCDVSHVGVVVHTRATSYALLFERMERIDVVRNALCYNGHALTLPQTKFSSMRDGVFFLSKDSCGQSSIGFSPRDIKQFVEALQRVPAANGKIVHS